MKTYPIIFSGPMIKRLLDGSKTQTRRLAQRHQRVKNILTGPWGKQVPGDLLWVRETWATVNSGCGPGWAYRADSEFIQPEYDGGDFGAGPSFNYEKYPGDYTMWYTDLLAGAEDHSWKSPLHMPRWASRLTLEMTDVRLQRLQEINHVDAMAEGVSHKIDMLPLAKLSGDEFATAHCEAANDAAREAYKELWNSLHGPDAWGDNPEVIALTFRVHHCNVDDFIKQKTA